MSNLNEIIKKINSLKDDDIWRLYGYVGTELRTRKLIRTRNIVGERGEFLAIKSYNTIAGLPNLQAAPEGTQNVDALSRKGERYSIKTITAPGSTTGVFYGLGNLGDQDLPEQKFEFVVLVVIDKNYNLKKIFELSWKQFLKYRKWHKTMRAWNLSITKALSAEAKIIISEK